MNKPVTVDESLAREFGLTAEEYGRVLSIMGRTPSLTELGVFSVMWSEHCSYKSSRKWLRGYPPKHLGLSMVRAKMQVWWILAKVMPPSSRWKATTTPPLSSLSGCGHGRWRHSA